jgi:type II secretory pathway component GspD/PulD (secretin)
MSTETRRATHMLAALLRASVAASLMALLAAAPVVAQEAGDFEAFPEDPGAPIATEPSDDEPEAAPAPKVVKRSKEDERDLILTPLPLLPPERADEEFSGDLALAGMTVEEFINLLSQKPFLDINVIIAANGPSLTAPVNISLSDITLGEAFALVLQLNELKAVRFNANTLIILDNADTRTFGVKRRKTYRLTYVSTAAVVEFIDNNPNLTGLLDMDNVIEDANNNSLMIIDSPDRIKVMDNVIALLDSRPNKVTARIPVSHVEFDDITTAIQSLPTEVQDRLNSDEMIFSDRGRTLIVYDSPEDIALLRDIIRQIDIGLKQVLIDASIMEVTETLARNIGLSLRNNTLEVTSIDKIWNLDRLRQDLIDQGGGTAPETSRTRLTYELQRQGGNTIANPKIRVVDQESATINIGQIRNVRVQSSQFSTNNVNTSAQTTFNTQEVPIGVTLSATPEIHNDGTVTLQLDIQDEQIITINEFGVDRTTRNSTTTLRIRDGETVILGGFINRNISYDKTPVPIFGQLPLLNKLFRNNSRSKIASELIILMTPYILDYDPVLPKPEVQVVAPGAPIKVKNFGYSQETTKPEIKTTTTRWIETPEERTKVIYDAMGEVIYQRSFPKDKSKGAKATPAPAPSAPEPVKSASTPPLVAPEAADTTPAPDTSSASAGGEATPGTEDWGGLMGELEGLANGG